VYRLIFRISQIHLLHYNTIQTISDLHINSLALPIKSFPVSICILLLHQTCYPTDLRFCWQQVVIVTLTKQLHVLMFLHCLLLCTPTIKQKNRRVTTAIHIQTLTYTYPSSQTPSFRALIMARSMLVQVPKSNERRCTATNILVFHLGVCTVMQLVTENLCASTFSTVGEYMKV
jgi:hypothetical protein